MQKRDIIAIGTLGRGGGSAMPGEPTSRDDSSGDLRRDAHVSQEREPTASAGPLPAAHAEDGEAIEHGRIYIAPPDHHPIVERDHVHLIARPKEQHQRPVINVTFRSAALAYGEHVAGVVLTGQLDDGTAGL
jgi:two-component system, chemotaxis family, protein-glutamate methylesterase/glutaminase